jgi:predicted nucleic acid-binding Zn ribbon protein
VFRVQGSGFKGSEFRVQLQRSAFSVQRSGFMTHDSGFRVPGSGFRVSNLGFRVKGSGFCVHSTARYRVLREARNSETMHSSPYAIYPEPLTVRHEPYTPCL